jgi:hypothetical protein
MITNLALTDDVSSTEVQSVNGEGYEMRELIGLSLYATDNPARRDVTASRVLGHQVREEHDAVLQRGRGGLQTMGTQLRY